MEKSHMGIYQEQNIHWCIKTRVQKVESQQRAVQHQTKRVRQNHNSIYVMKMNLGWLYEYKCIGEW